MTLTWVQGLFRAWSSVWLIGPKEVTAACSDTFSLALTAPNCAATAAATAVSFTVPLLPATRPEFQSLKRSMTERFARLQHQLRAGLQKQEAMTVKCGQQQNAERQKPSHWCVQCMAVTFTYMLWPTCSAWSATSVGCEFDGLGQMSLLDYSDHAPWIPAAVHSARHASPKQRQSQYLLVFRQVYVLHCMFC